MQYYFKVKLVNMKSYNLHNIHICSPVNSRARDSIMTQVCFLMHLLICHNSPNLSMVPQNFAWLHPSRPVLYELLTGIYWSFKKPYRNNASMSANQQTGTHHTICTRPHVLVSPRGLLLKQWEAGQTIFKQNDHVVQMQRYGHIWLPAAISEKQNSHNSKTIF